MDVSSIVKKGAPSVEPHELTIITDPDDPLYDRRLHLPISDEAILNFAAVGQVQPISVRPRGLNELVIVDGIQRWKRATVINHLTGKQAWRDIGKVPALDDAIARLRGAESDVGRRIVELAGGGMKLRVNVFRADDKEAQRGKASANEFREDDPVAEKARKAQQMSRHGLSDEEIRESFGVSMPTIQRWLALNPDEPKKRKRRGKAVRPSVKKLTAVVASLGGKDSPAAQLIGWCIGLLADADIESAWPEVLSAFKAAKKAKAKRG